MQVSDKQRDRWPVDASAFQRALPLLAGWREDLGSLDAAGLATDDLEQLSRACADLILAYLPDRRLGELAPVLRGDTSDLAVLELNVRCCKSLRRLDLHQLDQLAWLM